MEWRTEEAYRSGFWLGPWLVEPMLNRVSQEGNVVQVEPKVMQVLCYLAERPGRTVTKAQFMEEVWAGTVVTDDVLARSISELRKVLGDDWRDPRYVETIRKTGYRLIAPVRQRTEHAGDPNRESPGVAIRFLNTLERRWTAGVLLILFLTGIGVVWALRTDQPEPQPEPVSSTTPFTSFPGREASPAISPDGTRIAFVWSGGPGEHQNLYIKQIDSETPLRVTDVAADEWSPSWSPDGQFIAFVRRSGSRYGIYVVPAIGGTVRSVANMGEREIHSLDWSPDTSKQEIVVSVRAAPYQAFGLHVFDIDRDVIVPLTAPSSHTWGDTHPVYSADGRRLAFARGSVQDEQTIFTVDAGGVPAPTDFDGVDVHGLEWATDSRSVIVAASTAPAAGLWRVPVSGTPSRILTVSEGTVLEHPSLSSEASRLAYAQRTYGASIWELARSGGYSAYTARPLIVSTRWDGYPDVSPTDSATIAFASERSGFMEIWKAGSDGGAPVQLTTFESDSYSPRWSPEGGRIAFVSRETGDADVYVMDSDGRSVRPLTSNRSEERLPNWSADGLTVYFASDRSGSWQVWRQDVNGGQAEQVTHLGALEAQESPDGSALYFMRPDSSGIWRRPLLPATIAAATPIAPVSLASGAGQERDTTFRDSLAHEHTELVVPEIGPDDAGNWRVTEESLFFVRRSEHTSELMRLDLRTGRQQRIAALGKVPHEPALAMAADGSRFLCTQIDRDESDIFVVDQFH